MKILAINAGSSSLKFKLFKMPSEEILCAGSFGRIGMKDSFYQINIKNNTVDRQQVNLKNFSDCINLLIKKLILLEVILDNHDIQGIGHRVVHGGDAYSEAIIINQEVLNKIKQLSYLAPLHNPANALGIEVFNHFFPEAKKVAVFDTAFHQTMGEKAYIYPVPYEWYLNYGVRKYGFHGPSHQYINKRVSEVEARNNLKVITCHLGNGNSISAIDSGRCIDASMGFTPLAGLSMGTRSGDIDPFIIPYMMNRTNKTIDEVISDLNTKSGFLGICGFSDYRDIEEGIKNKNEKCLLSHQIFVRRIASFIATYHIFLGGADIICFSGGIGENSIRVREDVMQMLKPIGVKVDIKENNKNQDLSLISTADSKIKCYIIHTNEELMIARETYQLIK
ncbi:MAG: acetate/propionate family kinase [Bacilli bacterium]|jgi:acetate kinase